MVEVSRGGVESVEAYAGERFEAVVPRSSLPESIGEGPLALDRDDVVRPR